jgi:hypothetical protein
MVATTRSPTLRSLARLLAGWLVALLLVQGLAAAQGRVAGGWHRHVAPAATSAFAGVALRHAAWEPGHHHHHDGLQRHVHALQDASVVALDVDAQALADAAAGVLAAMTALPPGDAVPALADAAHVQHPARPWSLRTACCTPLRRPPRG